MSRGLGQMQHALLASLKPAKRAYAAGKFDYIGGAGLRNLEDHSDRAYAKAREQLAARGGKSNQPDQYTALLDLKDMYEDGPMSPDDVRVFAGGEHVYLGEGVFDLRATLRFLAGQFKHKRMWENQDRTANRGSSYWHMSDTFRISFYRAARNLVERGLLIQCDPDGSDKQLRFVSMRPDVERRYTEDDDPLQIGPVGVSQKAKRVKRRAAQRLRRGKQRKASTTPAVGCSRSPDPEPAGAIFRVGRG